MERRPIHEYATNSEVPPHAVRELLRGIFTEFFSNFFPDCMATHSDVDPSD
jgi:hypothetical protein